MDRTLSIGAAAFGTAVLVAFLVAGNRGGEAPEAMFPPPALEAASAELGARLRELAAAIDARASTLSDMPRLRAAVSTDADTMRGLTRVELAFHPQPGETIEIAQVLKNNSVERLYRSEGSAPAPALDRAGHQLRVSNGALYLADVVDVPPRDREGELHGALAVSRLVDTGELAAKLDALHVAATLVVGGERLRIGTAPEEPKVAAKEMSLGGELAEGAKLLVQLPVAAPRESGSDGGGVKRTIALGIALLSWLAAALLWRRGRARIAGSDEEAKVRSASALAAIKLQANVEHIQPRTRIGRYEVVRLLGSGGMADVYLARSTGEAGFQKLIALKVLQPHLSRHEAVVENFLDEARLASRLTHPNIVQISDLGRDGEEYFIAMEYVEGSDLERLLGGCRERGVLLPVRVALTIIRRVCDGLEAAHSAKAGDGSPLGLVHRDVKTANVFVARDGAVKIGDFGIAKANQLSRAQTEMGQVKGTAAYMAPEHRLGHALDGRADLYAAGAIAYELFTGTPVNLDLVRLIAQGIDGWPHLPPPSEVRPELPADLDAVIFKALAFERDARYESCQAFEEALESIAIRHGLQATDKVVAQWVESELSAKAATAAV